MSKEVGMNSPIGGAGSQFFSVREARSDAYSESASDERQRNEENWPQPERLRRKSSHTSFLASTLEPPKPSAFASSDSIFPSNATYGRVHSHFLYACAWASEFPAQALLRLRTDWQTQPVVVLDGRAPEESVCSLNRLAERSGAAAGMTRLEAESVRGLRLLKRSAENEAAARAVMLECVAKFSPRIEEVRSASSRAKAQNHFGGTDVQAEARSLQSKARTLQNETRTPQAKIHTSQTEDRLQNAFHANRVSEVDSWDTSGGTACAFVLDIAGTERLFGPPAQLAERLRDELAEAGFRAAIAVSTNFDTARMKAASMRGVAVIAEGTEAEALTGLPIAALGLDEEYATTFALWGIGTLGELAALPEAELVARMGPKARTWRALARGEAEHTFEPMEAEFALEEFCEFETPVEQIDSLLFVGARMIDCMATRAAGRALALSSLTVEMGLEGGGTHCVAIRPAVPTIDRKFLLKLLQLEIGAHPPWAGVVRLTLRAEAGAQSQVQPGLFAPQTPEPSRLDVTLARLRALVGEERVGSPVLEDTHRADGFRMEEFGSQQVSKLASQRVSAAGDGGRIALRRVRPARMVRVTTQRSEIRDQRSERQGAREQGNGPSRQGTGIELVAFSDGEDRYEIAAAYGPWRTSGCWELDAWDAEEWDVLAVRAEKFSSGAKAQNYFANVSARVNSCPDTSCSSGDVFSQHTKPHSPDPPNFLAVANYIGGRSVACLLTRDRARNEWRLEAFYD
jgi:protein ImuB